MKVVGWSGLIAATAGALLVASCGDDTTSNANGNGGHQSVAGGGGRMSEETPGGQDSGSGATAGAGGQIGDSSPAGGAAGRAGAGMGGSGDTNNGGDGPSVGGSSEEGGASHHGSVVDFVSGRSLAARRVVVGPSLSSGTARVTETDQNGVFSFEATESYQVLIIDPDGSTVSYYEGLTSSRPVLLHHSSSTLAPPGTAATVKGMLSGGATYPLTGENDMVVVHLLSEPVNTYAYLSGAKDPHGPDYALWPAFSDDRISASLLALGIFRDPTDENAYSAAAALTELSLSGDEVYQQDLTLSPIPLRRVRGKVDVPADWQLEQVSPYHRMPFPDAKILFLLAPMARTNPLTNAGAFDYEVPDLREFGGQLCITGVANDGADGVLWSERCGVLPDAPPIELDFAEVPMLTKPSASFGAGSDFSWSRAGSPDAPNLVELEPTLATSRAPAISIFTTSNAATLPDLEPWGIQLPSSAQYNARAVSLASDASDAFGPGGLGATIPGEWRMSYSSAIPLVVGP